MTKYFIYACFSALLFSACGDKEEVKDLAKTEKPEDLVVIENGVYTEYYPGKKQVKFRGKQDENKEREGQWIFYSETGAELTVAHYSHGVKHGHVIVKYPNGAMHYIGEFRDGKEVGIWRIYDEKGVVTEKDFGPAE